MRLFLISFFVIYGAIHLYVFFKARTALSLGGNSALFLFVFMVVMVMSPVIVRYSEMNGLEFLARIMSYSGYLWMGLLFLFFSLSLVFDIYRLVFHASGLFIKKDLSAIILPAGYSFFISLIFALSISIYGYFEAQHIRTEHIMIRTPKLPASIKSLRIVQISDVHLGLIVREPRLRNILQQVRTADPDILVSTGDLVDGQINKLEGLAELLGQIKPRYGKFAITGNHEFYAGLGQALDFIRRSGFTILQGEGVTIEGIIHVAGVDDPAGTLNGLSKPVSEKDLLAGFSRDRFILFLKHRPLVDPDAAGHFDLQLSGHTHKGQIFPFSLVTKLYYPSHAGILNLLDSSYLYVSRGSGTWGPPIRFLSPPEVTVIDIVNQLSR